MAIKTVKLIVPPDDSDLKAIDGILERGADYACLEGVVATLLEDLRACRRHLRRIDRTPLWHWARPGHDSGCKRMVWGDSSTDTYAENVTCPRCVKLPTRLRAMVKRGKTLYLSDLPPMQDHNG